MEVGVVVCNPTTGVGGVAGEDFLGEKLTGVGGDVGCDGGTAVEEDVLEV